MTTVRRFAAAACLGLGVLAGGSGARAAGLDCGVPHADRSVDPALAASLRSARHDPALDGNVQASIRTMSAAGMPKAEIVDRMLEAYCPVAAADPALTVPQKRDAVRDFASAVTDIVYKPAKAADAVVLSVSLPPAVMEEVRVAAARDGISRAEWVLSALTARLARP